MNTVKTPRYASSVVIVDTVHKRGSLEGTLVFADALSLRKSELVKLMRDVKSQNQKKKTQRNFDIQRNFNNETKTDVKPGSATRKKPTISPMLAQLAAPN